MRTRNLLIGMALIIVGTFFLVSSVTLVSCAGSLIVTGGCEGWQRGVVLTFWLIGALVFSAAVAILVFSFKSSGPLDSRLSDPSLA